MDFSNVNRNSTRMLWNCKGACNRLKGFRELTKIIFVFVLGFTFTIISIICIQRRTLEILVEESVQEI